jgi:hypothetical protein
MTTKTKTDNRKPAARREIAARNAFNAASAACNQISAMIGATEIARREYETTDAAASEAYAKATEDLRKLHDRLIEIAEAADLASMMAEKRAFYRALGVKIAAL